ncbi:hypothetical protein QYF36_014902 [Acer negundo]|nr:hypothetical protein QYF36_014902 [Acer negundo]
MGDHFVLLVDRLLTESTLEAAIESRNHSMQAAAAAAVNDSKVDSYPRKVDLGDVTTTQGKLAECRICQDDDVDSNMETPCSCRGSLKYAHRRCVQRWCNEKGNTTCEICHQQFRPGYTAPPPLFQFGHIPMSFRGNWEVSRRESNSPRIIAMVSTDRNFLPSPTYDDYSVSNTRSLLCCRTIALILMLLLILRHTLPVILRGTNEYSFPLFMLLFVRTVGIILPIYVIVKAVTALQRRRHQQEYYASSSFISSDEESEHSTPESPSHVVRVQ